MWANIILKGQLVTDTNQPVPRTKIAVSGGPVDITDFKGNFQIKLSNDFIEGERVIISVIKKGWVINHPLDGEWNLPNIKYQRVHTTRVVIVPYGSMKLWTHARIEKHVAQLSDQLAKMKKESSQPQPVDFNFYLKEWAHRYGFTPGQVKVQFDRWSEEVKNSDNYRTLGLRAFYLKNFIRAAKYFTKDARQWNARAKKIQDALWQAKKNEYESWKDAGNAYDAAYRFREALDAYQKAEAIATLEQYPRQWGEIRIYIGNAQLELGTRVTGEESATLLSAAVSSYRRFLQRITRQDAPQDWAMTQNNLGNALSNQGIRTGGAEGAALLAQVVQAYQKALEIRTKEQLPHYWAQTQNNLARLYETRENWTAAVRHYRQVYKVYPGYAANKLALLLHDRLFRFKEALEMNRYLVNRENDPDVKALFRLVENYFTAGLYPEGNRLIKEIKPVLTDPAASRYLILLAIFETGNWAGLDEPVKASLQLENLVSLVKKQPRDFKLNWDFPGSKYFIRTCQALEPHRDWLLTLFTALEKTGRDNILAELKKM
jgi:tetratricopeptide (TPR) repeat protein